MMLRQRLQRDGQWLFTKRGFLPVLVLLPAFGLVLEPGYPFGSPDHFRLWMLACSTLALAGQVVRFVTIAHVPLKTSGRNRRTQVAETLNTQGSYSVVRNPLYFGNCLSWLGLAAVPASPSLWVLVACVFWVYHERVIYTEEAFLEGKFGDTFRSWAARTPAFFPNPALWQPPAFGYSWRYALGREFEGFFLVVIALALLDTLVRSAAEQRPHASPVWLALAISITVAFVVIRWLRKKTNLFRVEGRSW